MNLIAGSVDQERRSVLPQKTDKVDITFNSPVNFFTVFVGYGNVYPSDLDVHAIQYKDAERTQISREYSLRVGSSTSYSLPSSAIYFSIEAYNKNETVAAGTQYDIYGALGS